MNAREIKPKIVFGRTLTVCALIASAWLLAACNTTEGVGEDIEAAGEGIQKAAD